MKDRIKYLLLFCLPFIVNGQNANKKEISVLFIGNSLTYYNEMQGMLQKMFDQKHWNFKVTQSAFAGMSLQGHLNDIITEKTASMISTRPKGIGDTTETEKLLLRKWDHIVLQEGTIRLMIPEVKNRIVIPAITAIKNKAKNPNTNFILFKTWPDKDVYPKQFCYPASVIDRSITKAQCCSPKINSPDEEIKLINTQYDSVALATKMFCLPITNCYAEIIKKHPEINLYDDEMHPSKSGAYLNACVYYKYFTKQNAGTLNYFADLDKKTALTIQAIVDTIYIQK